MKNKRYYFCFCILSGILAAFAFSGSHVWLLNFVAYVPLFYILSQSGTTKLQTTGYLAGFSFGYYFMLLNWLFILIPVMPVSEGKAKSAIVLGILILGTLNGFLLLAAAFIFPVIRQGNAVDVVILSFLFILGEWLQVHMVPLAFPWGRPGVCTAPFTAFVQSASLFGSLFSSFLVLLSNGLTAYVLNACVCRTKGYPFYHCLNQKKDRMILLGILLLLIANTIGGYFRIKAEGKEQNEIGVLLVQGNHSGLSKWNKTSEHMLEDYINLTKANLDRDTKIVVWPETAIPVYLEEETKLKESLIELCREYHIILFLGAFQRITQNGEIKEYNSLFQINENGLQPQVYHKQMLVPFGEYIPFQHFLKRFFPDSVKALEGQLNISHGTESVCFDTPYGKAGGIICYESIFPYVAGKSEKNGAELFIVASNDSWFGESAALYQHHSHSIMRAIENNRFLVRASNTAITSVISPSGEVTALAEGFKQTALNGRISFIQKRSLYSYLGDVIVLPAVFIWGYGMIKYISRFLLQKSLLRGHQSAIINKVRLK